MLNGKKVTLVLGGGGMKGLAHIGVLKALHRFGIAPDEYVGTSVGSYIAALSAGGLSAAEIEQIGLGVRREDLLDYDWWGLIWRRSRNRSLYRGKALHDFIRRTLPVDRFDRLKAPLYVTTVDLTRGQEVIWGMPGFTEVPIHDCVVASCALPGIYPPKKINRYFFVDGSVVDTLPIKVAVYHRADIVIAVYLDSGEPGDSARAFMAGVGSILMQSQSILSKTLFQHNLRYFDDAPVVLIRPRVPSSSMFDFHGSGGLIEEGERAAEEVLRTHPLIKPLLEARGETPPPFFAPPADPRQAQA